MIFQSYHKSFKFFPHIRPTYILNGRTIERLTIQYNTIDVENFRSDIHFLLFTRTHWVLVFSAQLPMHPNQNVNFLFCQITLGAYHEWTKDMSPKRCTSGDRSRGSCSEGHVPQIHLISIIHLLVVEGLYANGRFKDTWSNGLQKVIKILCISVDR